MRLSSPILDNLLLCCFKTITLQREGFLERVNQICGTCRSFLDFGGYCTDFRYVRTLDQNANYISVANTQVACGLWAAPFVIQEATGTTRHEFRTHSSDPDLRYMPQKNKEGGEAGTEKEN